MTPYDSTNVQGVHVINDSFCAIMLSNLNDIEGALETSHDERLAALVDSMRDALEEDVFDTIPKQACSNIKLIALGYKAVTERQNRVSDLWNQIADRVDEIMDVKAIAGIPQKPAIYWPTQ